MGNKELEKVISKLKKEKEAKEETEEEDDTEEEEEEETEEVEEKPKKKVKTEDATEQQIIALRDDGLYRTAKLYHLQEQNNLLRELIGIFKEE